MKMPQSPKGQDALFKSRRHEKESAMQIDYMRAFLPGAKMPLGILRDADFAKVVAKDSFRVAGYPLNLSAV